VTLKDGTTVHVHADRLWVDAGSLVFAEEKENPDAARVGEPETCFYTTVIFAQGDWARTFAASVVDGAPLPLVDYSKSGSACATSINQKMPKPMNGYVPDRVEQ
jgi:hypothetical protein